MDWKKYESEVHNYFLEMYPGAKITYDARIIGRYSKKERQIDVLIEGAVAGFPVKIVVDAKYFSKNIDVKCVESFIAMLDDVNATHGLLVTQVGYSDTAINRAFYGPQNLELDILNFEDLLQYQSLSALPYSDKYGIMLTSPFGWVIDATKRENMIASLYQRGSNYEKAQKELEFIYINYWVKDDECSSISELAEKQNIRMKDIYENVCIDEPLSPTRSDNYKTYIRIARWNNQPCVEVTGYIDCDEFIAFFVLLSKEEVLNRNLRKLNFILQFSKPFKISFDNTKVIEQLLSQTASMDDIEKAHAYCQIADWYKEMDNNTRELEYRELSWSIYPKTYPNIKHIIYLKLIDSNFEEARTYSLEFFKLDPTNPTVMQDLLSIFDERKYDSLFKTIISELKSDFKEFPEALGNITFHNAIYNMDLGLKDIAIAEFTTAKEIFVSKNICSDAISSIDSTLKEIHNFSVGDE